MWHSPGGDTTVTVAADVSLSAVTGTFGALRFTLDAGGAASVANANSGGRDAFVFTASENGAADFVSATAAQQTELVDLIAYRRNASPELTPGIEFFTLVRRMTVDAFYTSPIGIKDIDYRGNTPIGSYPAPTESIAYALKRSNLG